LTDGLAADGAADDRLDIGDGEPVAADGGAIDIDIHIPAAGQALRDRRAHPRHIPRDLGDAAGDAVDQGQIGPGDLDADGALDAGRQHVDAVADWRHPDVGQARNLNRAVELLDQLLRRHAGAPLVAWFELDRSLEHLQRRWIGGGFRPPRLAEHGGDLGNGADHPVCPLQQR